MDELLRDEMRLVEDVMTQITGALRPYYAHQSVFTKDDIPDLVKRIRLTADQIELHYQTMTQ